MQKRIDFCNSILYNIHIESCFGFAQAKYSRKDGAATLYFFIQFYYSCRNVLANGRAYSIFYYEV